jgi:hypothetical protein
VVAYFAVILLAAWVAANCVASGDFSSAAVVGGAATGVVGGVTGVAYAFYSHKAKCENIVKITRELDKEEIEEASQLAQSMGGLQ